MNKRETIQLYLNNGFQLSGDALSIIQEKPEKYLKEIKKIKPRPFMITRQSLEKIEMVKKPDKIKLEIVKEYSPKSGKTKVLDYTKHFGEIYETIKTILLKKNNLDKLTSVNKITEKSQEFSLIVSVREKNISNLLVEDTTGETHVFFEKKMKKKIENLEKDDIVGIVCERKDDEIHIKEILYPGLSITREVRKTKQRIKLFYLYKPSLLEEGKQEKLIEILGKTKKEYPVVIYGDWHDQEVLRGIDNIFLVNEDSDPNLFRIGEVKILLFSGKNRIENILEKRLIKGDSLLNTFALTEIPDIMFLSDGNTYYKNYKGTSIISNNDKNKYFLINLNSREVEEIDI
jgi:hypothetical protein